MSGGPTIPRWLGPALAVAARVALGVLWIREGMTKYRAGFGRADILLVVNSTKQNPRVPRVFSDVLQHTLGQAPSFAGIVVPAWETMLGVVLVLGIFSRIFACAAIGTLMTYWLSDQLIGQYPVMVVLAACVLVLPAAERVSLPWLIRWRLRPARATSARRAAATRSAR